MTTEQREKFENRDPTVIEEVSRFTLIAQVLQGHADFQNSNHSAAEAAVRATHDDFAAYETRKTSPGVISGRITCEPFVPIITTTPEGEDPFSFVEEISSIAKTYLSKTEIIVMQEATASDKAAESVNARLVRFGRKWVNPFLITLDLLSSEDMNEAQLARRDGIRQTISGLLIPSLIVVSHEATQAK